MFDSVIFVITLFNENTKSKQDCGKTRSQFLCYRVYLTIFLITIKSIQDQWIWKTRSQFISIDPEVFDILMNIVEISEEKIDVKKIILYFRENFRLVDQISALLLNLDQIEISDSKNIDTEEIKACTENHIRITKSSKFDNLDYNFDKKVIKIDKIMLRYYRNIVQRMLSINIMQSKHFYCKTQLLIIKILDL